MKDKLLLFRNENSLKYWFRYIVNRLKKTGLVLKVKRNDYIEFGAEKWFFRVETTNTTVGWRDAIFYDMEVPLEKDFKNTIIEIIKGETDGYKRN